MQAHTRLIPTASGLKYGADSLVRYLWFSSAIVAVLAVFFILVFLLRDGVGIVGETGLVPFLFGDTWNPTGTPPAFGTFPLIVGTVLVTIGAMAIAAPLGIGSAIFIAELAPSGMKTVLKPAVELLAGIPSVVYGFFGLVVLTDLLRVAFDVPSGESWLAASILLGIMALPSIISVAEDAITAVPRELKEGSLAIGATHWQTISRVIVPSALSGITAALILGMGRAIGETMAVMMVAGNAAIIPSPITDLLSPVRTLTGTLGIEMGEVAAGSSHYHALFGVAVVLLAMTLLVNSGAVLIMARLRETDTVRDPPRRLVSHETGDRIRGCALPLLAVLLIFATFLAAGPVWAAAVFTGIIAYVVIRTRISRTAVQKLAFGLITGAVAIVVAILAVILSDIVVHGVPALSWDFLTQGPSDLGRAGGIYPAIVGTLCLVGGAILLALPLGVGAAIYLIEYTRENALTRIIRTGVDLLNGTPSIVFGLFGFAFLVLYLGLGVSLLAGQVTLGLMVLPTIIRTTEEALNSVPKALREGSLAMGATRWQTIWRVVLPPAMPGIVTGTILSIGRAAGETAPILFTAVVFSRRFLPSSLAEPVMALPYHLFILSTSVPGARTNQYGTALVLLLLVMGFYLLAVVVRTHYQKSVR
ncbi:MAG: phosphate ABC transporter permease PstA [Methanomicrobiales archaeon]|nr:phosphate ABC transporter permease PstA [Methanomicrobiales archaeon]